VETPTERRRTISTATQSELDELRDHINLFVSNVVDPLLVAGCDKKHEHYVIDLALRVLSDDAANTTGQALESGHSKGSEPYIFSFQGQRVQLLVVELNAFAPAATGAGCFSWKNDLEQLWPRFDGGTQAPAAPIRVRQVPRPSFEGVTLLPVGYEDVIHQALMLRRQLGH
jgi:hypothetical protein